jgi:hypothetical protein
MPVPEWLEKVESCTNPDLTFGSLVLVFEKKNSYHVINLGFGPIFKLRNSPGAVVKGQGIDPVMLYPSAWDGIKALLK